ncbi:hypothetical protein [Mycobacterium gordonae]|uniref:Uncharacterized protein n=1 Tax=Mycobacterium gordonae TaxID=1778 RepID=A0A1X1VYM4_MYCGO|nr:hypothetical protein [Mycobacterium gordonae]MCV7006755.1 hypothetical protein [Mycobacterium gordonae]ODR16407.1 hypothetical protein BHQ23_30045 [Mycobacterium gordonae]ORV75018.1 hypothetical protein AWC08_00755 [Mycobacterium gordonae]
MKAAEWISLAGVVVTVVATTWAIVSAKRAAAAQSAAAHYQARAEQNAERATKAAEDAAVAQRQAALEAGRAAAALEEQNRRAEEQSELAEGVPWRITYRKGSLYDLWNDTGTTKFGVQISGEGVLRAKTVDRFYGRSSVEFLGLDAMGVGDEVEVRWHRREDHSDEPPQLWVGNKPPRL